MRSEEEMEGVEEWRKRHFWSCPGVNPSFSSV